METKTIYLSSLYKYEELTTPHIYKLDDKDLYVDALYEQEASLKATLALTKIDRLAISVDEKTYALFTNKEFSIKDFNSNENNAVVKFLNRIKDFIFVKQDNVVINDIDASLFLNNKKEQYLWQYFNNQDTQSKVNAYLIDKDPYSFINKLYKLSNQKAVCLKDNGDLQVYVNLYGSKEEDINFSSIQESINKFSSLSSHINVYYDTIGLLSNDYHFLTNMLNVIDKDDKHYSILGVLNIQPNKDNYVSTVVNSSHVPDLSVILSYIKSYAKTSKLVTLKQLKQYFIDKNLQYKFLDMYISALSFIESGVALCNIAILKYGINILKKVHEYNIDTKNNNKAEIVFKLFRQIIDEKFGKLISTPTLQVSKLIQWCIDNEYYQQALTIIESLAPDDMVKGGIIYYANDAVSANKIIEKWNYWYYKESSRTKYVFDDLSHYFLKNYGRNGINNAQPRNKVLDDLTHAYLNATKQEHPKLGKFFTNLKDDQLMLDLLLQYYKIGYLRNEVAHAMPQEEKGEVDFNNLGEDETYIKVQKETKKFSDLFTKALSLCKGNKPYIISNKQFMDYVHTHKIEYKKNYNNQNNRK